MKLLHTADWHVGKSLRGRSRADEHREVLSEIAQIAKDESVDATLISGDIFDSSAPSAEAEEIVYKAYLDLAAVSPVLVIAGNHDHAQRLGAVAPVLERLHVQTASALRGPDSGGVFELSAGSERAKIGLLPFISQRQAIQASQLMNREAAENVQHYRDCYAGVVRDLCAGMDASTINILAAHVPVVGATKGGGEREAFLIDEYYVSQAIFPTCLQYVALGHLHAPQTILGGCPISYSGSPLQLDFGETNTTNSVKIVEVEPGLPARVREVELKSGKKLVTIRGTMADVERRANGTAGCYVKVFLAEPARAGLADDIRALFPDPDLVLDVVLDRVETAEGPQSELQAGISPRDLFRMYLEDEVGKADDALLSAFSEVSEEQYAAG